MEIWELEPHFKCPIVGAVLSLGKHRDILKKCGYDTGQMKPYEYHQVLMSKLGSCNHVSIKVNNYMKSKKQLNRSMKSGARNPQITFRHKQM